MGSPSSSSTPNSVYRTPGRPAEVAPVPPPSWRTLLAPLGLAAGIVGSVVIGIAAFNLVVPAFAGTSSDVRLIPAVDGVEDVLAVGLPFTLVLLIGLIVRRVQPAWSGLGLHSKVAYVLAALVVQLLVVGGGEAAIFFDRGGLQLFGPTYKTTALSRDGRMAHLYTVGGLSCGYDVYVSGPLSLTAKKELRVSRATCLEPTPQVRWNDDGSVNLVDAKQQVLEPQTSPGFSFWGGGC